MLFWILIGLILVVSTVIGVANGKTRWSFYWRDFWRTAGASLVVGIIMGFIVLLGLLIHVSKQEEARYETDRITYGLRALTNDETQPERYYFLGSGQSGDEPVFNFIYTEDGGARLDMVSTDDAIVFEDATVDTAYLDVITYGAFNGFILPYPVSGVQDVYEFHIPANSVDNYYSISVEE